MQYIDSCLYDLVSHVNIMPHIMVHLHKSTLVYLPTYIVLSAVIIHRTHTRCLRVDAEVNVHTIALVFMSMLQHTH